MSQKDENSLCNERNFEIFFKTHAAALRNFLIVKFSDSELAEDLTQEAFIKIWNICATVIPKTAKSYLFTIGINLGINKKRHDQVVFKHQNLIVSQNVSITNESPEFVLLEKEFADKFKQVVANLSEKQRTVFLLNRVEKKTYREIAEINQVSVKAIEKLMHKALQSIKKEIGDLKF